MSNRIEIVPDRHLKTLANCGGYYECPRGPAGTRLGPLVGYAGKYQASGGKMLQFVGDIYANFSRAEVHPHVLNFFAQCLLNKLWGQFGPNVNGVVGAPIGGYGLADAIALVQPTFDIRIIKAEKRVTRLATADLREQSELVFARHDIEPGLKYVIVEDVCNNFSTTAELINLIYSAGGKVIAIACFLNRSLEVGELFAPTIGNGLPCWPVISLVRQPIQEYRQDDPAVAEDIARGNVVLKPKNEWPRLMKAMTDHQPENGVGW